LKIKGWIKIKMIEARMKGEDSFLIFKLIALVNVLPLSLSIWINNNPLESFMAAGILTVITYVPLVLSWSVIYDRLVQHVCPNCGFRCRYLGNSRLVYCQILSIFYGFLYVQNSNIVIKDGWYLCPIFICQQCKYRWLDDHFVLHLCDKPLSI